MEAEVRRVAVKTIMIPIIVVIGFLSFVGISIYSFVVGNALVGYVFGAIAVAYIFPALYVLRLYASMVIMVTLLGYGLSVAFRHGFMLY